MMELCFTDCVELVGAPCPSFDGKKRYISTGAVDVDHISETDVELVDYKGRPSRANLVAECGDILFAKMQGTKKTLQLDMDMADNIYSTGFCAVRARASVLTPKCLYHLLTSNTFLRQKDLNCSGATQKAITNAALRKIAIKIPAMKQQEIIANQLDSIVSIIEMRQRELEQLDKLVKSRFVEMFGEPINNSKGWTLVPLGKRCKIVTGNTPSRAEPENYGKFIEWIKSDNINTPYTFITEAQEYLSEAGFRKCRFVETGSLLMTCIAGSINCIGNVAITNRRVAFNQQINAIVPEQDNVLYLYWLMILSQPLIHSTINMSLKGILSKGQLAELAFPFPPIELQEEFANIAKQIDKSKAVIQKSLDEAQVLFDSLMQQYFG